MPNQVTLLELDHSKELMAICDSRDDCPPQSAYWFPLANLGRLEVFMKLAKINCISTLDHFTKLVASRIVVKL